MYLLVKLQLLIENFVRQTGPPGLAKDSQVFCFNGPLCLNRGEEPKVKVVPMLKSLSWYESHRSRIQIRGGRNYAEGSSERVKPFVEKLKKLGRVFTEHNCPSEAVNRELAKMFVDRYRAEGISAFPHTMSQFTEFCEETRGKPYFLGAPAPHADLALNYWDTTPPSKYAHDSPRFELTGLHASPEIEEILDYLELGELAGKLESIGIDPSYSKVAVMFRLDPKGWLELHTRLRPHLPVALHEVAPVGLLTRVIRSPLPVLRKFLVPVAVVDWM